MRAGLSVIPALSCVALDKSPHLSKTQAHQPSGAVVGMAKPLELLSLKAIRIMAPSTHRDTLSSNPLSPEGINVAFQSKKSVLPTTESSHLSQNAPQYL